MNWDGVLCHEHDRKRLQGGCPQILMSLLSFPSIPIVEGTFPSEFSFHQNWDVTGGRGKGKGCVALLLEALVKYHPLFSRNPPVNLAKAWCGSSKEETEGQKVWHFRNPAQSIQTVFCLFCQQLLSQISLLWAAPTETVVNNKAEGKH